MSDVVPRRPQDVVRDCFEYAPSAPQKDFVTVKFVREFVQAQMPEGMPAEDKRKSVTRWFEEVNPDYADSSKTKYRRKVGDQRCTLVPFVCKTQPATQPAEPLRPLIQPSSARVSI